MAGETRKLARSVIEHGLLGRGALFESELPPPPPGYEIERAIGRGGAGRVFLARDLRLGRPVAIKYLSEAAPADVERFRREARFTARLRCPSIVQIYELGEVDGQSFIAMQYLEGGNLAAAHLDFAGVARVVRDVAAALDHAHAEGIVHRDIKPENILLDGEGRGYLTDFGIARDVRGAIGATMSREGQIIGTPGLMPPEQARGDHQAIDARSDVYALGATLFHKLTGRYPFERASLVEVLHAVIHDDAPLPRSIDASIPRALEEIVLRCLRKARDERYASMQEIVTALDFFLAGEPAHAGSAWFSRLVRERFGAPEPAPFDDAGADPWWSASLEVVREIAAWDADLYRVTGSLERSFERLDALDARLGAVILKRPDLAWARFYRGVALFRRGRLDEARDEMERSIDRVANLAGAYFELGRLYLALFLRSARIARRHLSPSGVESDLGAARGWLVRARVAFDQARKMQGRLPPGHDGHAQGVARLAESDYAGCVAICDRVLAREPDLEEVWKLRGDAQRLLGDDECFASYARAAAVRRTYFEAYYAEAEAHLERGRVDDARRALDRALVIHPAFAEAYALRARADLVDGEAPDREGTIARGMREAERALAIDPRCYDAAVTGAELRLACAAHPGSERALDEQWYASTIELLERAAGMGGCMNRVALLEARVRCARARATARHGGDARAEFERILAMTCADDARTTPSSPWTALRQEIERELGA